MNTMKHLSTKISIEDMNLEGKSVAVVINAEYTFPINWLADYDNGTSVIVNNTDRKNFERLIVEFFARQLFNDCFGKLPAEKVSLISLKGEEKIRDRINKRIDLAISKEKEKAEKEAEIKNKQDKAQKAERISRLKKELAELEKNVG